MKILKIAALVIGALALLAGAVLAYVAATFDPNDYKPQIVELVREHSQRTLKLEGNIQLAFWPGIGAELGKLSLSERNSDKLFMSVDGARFSLKLLPLLSKQLVVDEVTVRGARINLSRDRKGRLNLEGLIGGDAAEGGKPETRKPAGEPGRQFAFDIDRVMITDSMLEFHDETAGTRYAVSKLNLQTGRIASGVPADIRLTMIAQADRPMLDVAVDLKTRLAFDAGQKSAALEQLVLDIRGKAATLENLEFKLELPAVAGTLEAFKAAVATIDAGFRQDGRAFKLRLASPVNGNLQTQQFTLPQLKASVSASGAGLPGQGISGELTGSASADVVKENLRLDLSGTLAGSTLKARLGIAGFDPSAYSFDIDLDQLDVDRLLPVGAPAGKGSGTPSASASTAQPAATPTKSFDVSALKALRADGNLRIGALTVNKLKLQNLRAGLKAGGGRLSLSPLSAGLYQGTLEGSATVDAAPKIPVFALKQTLAGVSLAPLLKDLADNETLEGRGTVTVDLNTRGNTADALKRALSGTAALQVADGALKGIDIAGAIHTAKARLGTLKGEQTQQADARQKTDFSELTASFRIADGVARNNDLSMKSPLLRVGGEGEINIGADSLNYLVKASIVGTSKGQGGRETDDLRGLTIPVRVSGPLKAPSYRLDFGAMVTDTVRQKAEDALKKRVLDRLAPQSGAGSAPAEGAKSGGSARDALKGLLGR
ncbi:MAG: AsmA family protein [Burkholderiales bacterium]|nr:AsmA family protein [Burkholderiales bacterium]